MKHRGGYSRGGDGTAHAVVSEIEILPPVMRGTYPRVTTEELRQAVENQLGCRAVFVYSAPVRHVFGDTLWERRIHVFLLEGQLGVSQAYAWLSGYGDVRRVHVVREGGGIMGPAHAVRAVLMMEDGSEPTLLGCGPDWMPVAAQGGVPWVSEALRHEVPGSWGGRET